MKKSSRPKATSASFVSEIFDLNVDRMAFGGSGVGRRADGKVVFVPFSAPGDHLKVRTTADHKTYFEAEIVEILKPSESRTAARCEVFGKCGGCSWQHLKYSEQLNQKEQIVRQAFEKRQLKAKSWLPIVACEQEFNYRNRIQLQIQSGKWGYFARKSHDFIAIEKCPIAEENLNQFLKKPDKARDGRAEISLNADLLAQFRYTEEDFGSHDFAQVNRFQNKKLILAVISHAKSIHPASLLDLYAGSGNFTFPLFEELRKTNFRAVELSPPAVQAAQARILENQISPKVFSFFCGDVEAFLVRQSLSSQELVLLDPPRMGCSSNVIRNLAHQPIQQVIYISCNPMTLVRDLALWKTLNQRLQIQSVQAFDMFPQTDHVEVMVTLQIDTAT
jgi:23S rRNA (uracil1939-C5)-methyltransferase